LNSGTNVLSTPLIINNYTIIFTLKHNFKPCLKLGAFQALNITIAVKRI